MLVYCCVFSNRNFGYHAITIAGAVAIGRFVIMLFLLRGM